MTASTKDGVKTSYTYAGASMVKLLSQATDGGSAYRYTYGKSGTLTARTVAGVGTASVLNDPSGGRPVDLRTTDGTTTMWIINGIGNPAAAITDQGAKAYTVSYSPYGGENVSCGDSSIQWQQNPFGFKGGTRASSTSNGLTKFGYRWQSAVTGGWIERDTLDAPLDPNNANRYAFAGSDPINGSDPTGRSDVGTFLGFSSALLSGVGLIASATGVGAGVGIGLGIASSAANVASLAVDGAPPAAIGSAAVLGVATLGIGGLGAGLKAGNAAGVATGAFSGLEIAAGSAYTESQCLEWSYVRIRCLRARLGCAGDPRRQSHHRFPNK
ncbi:RHS repeat-associated core domain-containing protein [Curtobacterium sp. NPDC089185]|uniref:RHS repeat-associated core domain-containing protein n=1 Tax=Curtobacterium sp. NPDC089185 TaxID=3154968 RepID=UPI003430DE18